MKKNECGVWHGIRHLLNRYLLLTEMVLLSVFGLHAPAFAHPYNRDAELKPGSANSGFEKNDAIDIKGKVKNDKGEPLPGVTVLEKGTTNGTTTDANGNFSINVSNANAVLVISYVGFNSVEVPANNAGRLQNITLTPETGSLTDIVVIGYGTAKKSDLTGAVAVVKADQLMDRPVPNVTQALQGKVAGVDVSVNNNAPGAGAKVRVRGLGSINSSLDPLYVVDGVAGVDGNSINPNDIASLEVLKDASSTAIYGARGANGVIMITTKRGRSGGTSVTYDGNVNVGELYRHLPALDAQEFVDVYNLSFANGQKFDPLGGVWTPPKALNHTNFPLLFDANDKPLYNTNWESEVYKPAVSHSHQLNFQGGNDKTLFSVSLGYLDQDGIMANSNFKRYSARFTLDNDVNRWLKIGGNLSLIKSRQRVVSDGNGGLNVPRMVTEEVPILPVKYPDGTWAGNSDIDGLEGGANPVHIAQNRYTLNNNFQTLGNTYLLFHITKDLDFKSDFGFNLNDQKNNFYSAGDLHNLSQDQGGVANLNAYNNTYWQSENYLTWNKEFSNGHKMTALLGASWQEFNQERIRAEAQNFIDDIFQWHYLQAGSVRSAEESQDYKWAMNSYFARVTYNISDKYLFTATGRYDGSSKFGANKKYAFFPSVGAAWRVSEENFMKDNSNSIISNLKVRASYGTSGNQEIGQYQSIAQIQPSTTVLNGSLQSTLIPSYLGNPDLKWEISLQADGGVELGLFNNRINLTADYYNRVTKDLLLQAPIPWSAGLNNNFVYINVGSVRNSGVELNLNTVNIKSKNFTWSTNFIFAANKNKIIKLKDGNADIFPGPNFLGQTNILRVGEAIGSFWGRTRLGTYSDKETDLAASQGLKPGDRKYLLNADGSENYSIIGHAYPKWTGNFNSTINYKNWDFSFDIRFVEGINTAATFKHSSEDRQTIANSLKTVLDAWTPEHQNTMISQVRNYKFAQDSKFDTWWVEDGSFIRGQNVVLGYTLPSHTLDRLKINKLRIYASVQNLFIITKYTGYDPEVDTYNSSYGANGSFSQNLDFFSYPRPRVWNAGVTLNF
ncbi:TonB-dependent receptor [Agriterribacter sp.]|uniref:SusC/RagA family TonB-linked outer membrane protein n=1 Tax=Agriterribacter sp. TaxID=2821509 RepID=UPI002CDE334D|nr:TonB-dependent receptor [Agriterribacter sp.]HTN06853.1 TonB-dependent receptor [Agriterribacter sp.]